MALSTDTQQDTSQTAMIPQEEGRPSLEKIRPDLNLEKWSIWQPAYSHNKKSRTLRREVTDDSGNAIASEVMIGYVDGIGTLTTEDQKTCYALIKIWEEGGRPREQAHFSLRKLSRVKKKRWGKNVIDSETHSLTRLRAIPMILKNAYYDSTTKETVETLEAFNILSDLKIIKRKADGHVTKEAGFFKFNDYILKNLLNNYTKPLLLDVVLSFESEIAQLLYVHLDLIMARRDHYERRTNELFSDLGLVGKSYRNVSNRKQKLERALKELKGVRLTTGIITIATLKRTKDEKDYKLVIHKNTGAFLPLAEHAHGVPENGGVVATPLQPVATNSELTTRAKELVAHFHKRFHNTETSTPSSKELTHATVLIASHGPDQARHIVDFSYQAAQETHYQPQTFGGILQYIPRALAAFEETKRKEIEQTIIKEEQRKRQEQDHLRRQYEDYRRDRLAAIHATTPPDTLTAIEQAVGTQFDQANTSPFGRDRMRRIAIDNAIAAHFELPSLEDWRATQSHG